ncbi:MAG TPA: Tm-1-like ATP-binding domain-containing protein [Chthoniobacterales bacterium]
MPSNPRLLRTPLAHPRSLVTPVPDPSSTPRAYIVGTGDTKGEELRYVRDLVAATGLLTSLVDIGTRGTPNGFDVSAAEVASFHPEGTTRVFVQDRGEAVAAMALAFTRFLQQRTDVAGAIGLAGSGGSAIIAPAFRTLPVGVPKMLVSTMAGSDVSAYVDASDLQMLNPVTDLAGLNRVTRVILGNAAHALAGMVSRRIVPPADERPAVGLTMYGVTTPCLQAIVARLKPTFDGLVFHATSTGVRSLERLLESGYLAGFIDVTTSDIPDLLFGGFFPASTDRLGATARTGFPYVGSCGALDMVNFRAPETVPDRYRKRKLHPHNPYITLMRTTPEENRLVGHWIGERLNRCAGPVRFLIPEKGVSGLDAPGGPFFDPEADEALFAAIEESVVQNASRRVLRLPLHLNDPRFAEAISTHFFEAVKNSKC